MPRGPNGGDRTTGPRSVSPGSGTVHQNRFPSGSRTDRVHWERRRDLEGGKELGVWLLVDDEGAVDAELYVESHEYRGGGFDVYTATPDDEWTHVGEFGTREAAFDRALAFLEASDHPIGRR